LCGKRGGSRR